MYISAQTIEEEAERFLIAHHPSREIPVPIEKIVEIDLGISVVPLMGLLKNEGVDAFLSHDFQELYIDHDHYMGQTNRSRFTLAHEIGHYVLHKEIVSQITSMEQWKKFILGEGTSRAFYEIHADIFAGCLLMPRAELMTEYELQKIEIEKIFKAQGMSLPDMKTLNSYMANTISKKFDVSQKSAEIRLGKIIS